MNVPEQNSVEYQEQFDKLFLDVGTVVRNHLSKQPYSQGAVFRVLNVLAAHVATVLAGCDDPEADRFFHACLNGTLQTAREDSEIANPQTSG